VSKADGQRRAEFNSALGCVKRKTPQLSSDEIGSLRHDDPCFTTASQARHAPRAVSSMNRGSGSCRTATEGMPSAAESFMAPSRNH
jgi:hypothetical protein